MVSSFDFLNALATLEASDGVIIVATDVGFGLACLPNHPEALARIRQLQPNIAGFSLVSHSREAMSPFIGEMALPQASAFQPLMKAHWPGLLTCMVPIKPGKLSGYPEDTIGIRIPNYPFLTEFTQMLPEQVLLLASPPVSQPISGCFLLASGDKPPVATDTLVSVTAEGQMAIVRQGTLDLQI